MKTFTLFLCVFFMLFSNTNAEIYHGINIDKIYQNSDWSSKEKIKEIIDDYILLIQYQKELDTCPNTLPEILRCFDNVAEKIITNLYVYPEHNIKEYKQLKKALSDAYGLKNCRNKYAWPSGHMCDIDRASDLADSLKKYIIDLLNFSKTQMLPYSSILEEYK